MAGSGGGRIAESAKARLRRASLLQNEDYKNLLEQSSVGDVAVQLGKTSYGAILENFSLEGMRRAELEFLLDIAVLAEGVVFRHYMGPADRKLLDLWLENFDIELFKNHFRIKLGTGEWGSADSTQMIRLVSDFHLTLVDQEKLFASSTLKDIMASVRKDSLRNALAEAIPAGRDIADITGQGPEYQKAAFALGMILDRHYFDNLYAAAQWTGGNEGRMLRMLVGTRVDLMNLYWIYRGRRFFNMAPEEALTLIMKVRYHVDFELLTKIAFADPAAYSTILKGTPYGQVFEVDEKDAGLREVQVESNIYRVLFNAVTRVFMSGSSGFQNVAAYLMLKEFEVRDLVAVVEAVRYGLDRGSVGKFLIRTLNTGGPQGTNAKSGD